MSKIHNIAKNTSYLTIALILQKIISFTYFALLARYLGPVDLGKYYFAISLTTIFAIFIDLGLSNVLTREVAKDQSKVSKYLGNILTLKVPLAALSSILAVLTIYFLQPDPIVKQLVYISCFSMVLDSFTSVFFAAVRGFHNLKYESISSVIFQVIVLIFGYGALLLGGGLIFAMGALVLASLYNFIYSWVITTSKLKIKIGLFYDKVFVANILKITWPFAVYAIFQRLYTYLDTVILSFFAGNEQVGLYQVAFKIIFALQFLPMAFTASLYPAMSAYWQNNQKQLNITLERALNYLTIISLPIIVGVFLLADKIVLLFKDGYEGSVLPLKITIISLFFIFVNFPIGSLLNACDRQKRNTINMGLATIFSIILNLILIPRFQAIGASIAILSSSALMFFLGLISVNGIIPYYWGNNLKVLFKSLIAAILMGIIIIFGKQYFSIFPLIPLGAIIYFISLYLLKGFRKADVESIFKSLKL